MKVNVIIMRAEKGQTLLIPSGLQVLEKKWGLAREERAPFSWSLAPSAPLLPYSFQSPNSRVQLSYVFLDCKTALISFFN